MPAFRFRCCKRKALLKRSFRKSNRRNFQNAGFADFRVDGEHLITELMGNEDVTLISQPEFSSNTSKMNVDCRGAFQSLDE